MHSFTWYCALALLFAVVLFLSVPSDGAEEDCLGTVGAATLSDGIGKRIWLDYEKTVFRALAMAGSFMRPRAKNHV